MPPITAVFLVIALVANWKTSRRWLLITAFALFILGGLLAGILLEPEFARITEGGYHDWVDPQLRERARSWYALDWATWSLTLFAGIALLLALAHPAIADDQTKARPLG